MTAFTKEYFIAKFTAIPDELWCTGRLTDPDGRHCAFGFCDAEHGARSKEGRALLALFPRDLAAINDGVIPQYAQPTPRARILAALNDLP